MAIVFTSVGVAVTPKINMSYKKAEVVSVWHVLLTSQQRKTVIVCFGDVKTRKLDKYCYNLQQIHLSRQQPQTESTFNFAHDTHYVGVGM